MASTSTRHHQLQWRKIGPRGEAKAGLETVTSEEVPVLEPPLEPRDEAVFLLQIAAEVEHALMVQYLYAAYSLKGPDEVPPEHAALIGRWKDSLLAIAREEMGHYLTVQNLLRLLGGPLHYDRGDPLHDTLHPFPFRLEPFTRESLARYIIAELPRTTSKPLEEILRRAQHGRSTPPGPLHRVGRIYERLAVLLTELSPEDCSLQADSFQGVESEWRGGADVLIPPATTLPQAIESVRRISLQGEGLHVQEGFPSHFDRFMEIDAAWPAGFVASRPVPSGPALPRGGEPAASENHITHPVSRQWAELFNLRYRLLLGFLSHALMLERSDSARRSFLVSAAFSEMVRVLGPIARKLTTLPRHPSRPATEAAAGPVFELPYTTDLSDRDPDRWRKHVDVLDMCAGLLRSLREASGQGEDAALLQSLQAADEAARRTMAQWSKQGSTGSEAAPVIVAGAGPAGLSAAMALARSGLKVRLVEYAPRVGGKVNSHHENGRSYEHGVHGWWNNYLNFNRLLDWAGVDRRQALKDSDASNLVLTTGQSFQLKNFTVQWPSPLFLAIHMMIAPYLSIWDLLRAARFFIHLMAFDHARDYARYDGFSFQQLMDHCGVSRNFQERVLEPFILSFDFTTSDRVSAACGLSGMQFYVVPDQRSIQTRWARGLPDDVIFSPIVRKLRELGVEVSLSTALEKVEISDGQVTGVRLGQTSAGAPASASVTRLPMAEVPSSDFRRMETAGGNVWMGKVGDSVVALNARCTHMGCDVDWSANAQKFVCPCHGSQFSPSGQVVRGPAAAPLSAIPCRFVNGDVEVTGATASTTVPCRDVVIATDLEAAKRILAASPGVPPPLIEGMSRLDTNPVIVVRMWFDPAVQVSRSMESALTPVFRFIDNFFDLNQFDEAIRPEGHVIEVQSYRVTAYLDYSDEELLAVSLDDLAIVYPELRGVRPSHYTVNRHLALFTRYAPGKDGDRPGEVSGVSGLHLSGDWTRTEWSTWMMERGVSTGLRAANAVLRKRGMPEVPLLRLPEEHWLLRVTRALCRFLRATIFRGLPSSLPVEPAQLPAPAPATSPAPEQERAAEPTPRKTGTDDGRR